MAAGQLGQAWREKVARILGFWALHEELESLKERDLEARGKVNDDSPRGWYLKMGFRRSCFWGVRGWIGSSTFNQEVFAAHEGLETKFTLPTGSSTTENRKNKKFSDEKGACLRRGVEELGRIKMYFVWTLECQPEGDIEKYITFGSCCVHLHDCFSDPDSWSLI